ncbi:MAG: OB-fold nucleic acid binding domain-containing protein, partial [Chitinivibrionales bacterium]
NRLINEYLRRLHGGRWTPEHPVLGRVLAETYGIMVYQEDVARVAMALAGFNFVEADALRKVMSKKDKFNQLESYRIKFVQGARKNGASDQAIQKIWGMCRSFAGYSFCKPHSASYVQVSFQSAWLKAHYPACFMAGVLSNYGGFYSTQAYISEAQRLGITVEGPDINHSEDRYRAQGMTIWVGLCQIKGLSAHARRSIIEQRRFGPYRSLDDFLYRCRIEENDAERLIAAGACDLVEPGCTRPQLFWKMRCGYRRHAGENPPPLKQYSPRQLLSAQYRMLGFLTERHPVTLIQCPVRQAVKIRELKSYVNRTVCFLGWCITSKTVSTRLGESMQFVTFEDETGLCESVLFPDAYLKFVHKLQWHEAFIVWGKVTLDRGALVVEVSEIRDAK